MKKLLVIYTGGTIGMIKDPKTSALHPFDFGKIHEVLPVLKDFDFKIDSLTFDPVMDSSNMTPAVWIHLAEIIGRHYKTYDGFVILHGTDTMSFTASALSFLLENLGKPVVLTGSQLPLGVIRTDGRENIINALEIAATQDPVIPEVCIFFDNKLYRGNRTTKYSADNFSAFLSGNYPSLAQVGLNISFRNHLIVRMPTAPLKIYDKMDDRVLVMKLFPGMRMEYIEQMFNTPDLQAVVLETFGSGNASTEKKFLHIIENAVKKGIIIYNITQCAAGSVDMGHYETSVDLVKMGVIGGYDITTESALTKMMFLLGNFDKEEVKEKLSQSLRGEITL